MSLAPSHQFASRAKSAQFSRDRDLSIRTIVSQYPFVDNIATTLVRQIGNPDGSNVLAFCFQLFVKVVIQWFIELLYVDSDQPGDAVHWGPNLGKAVGMGADEGNPSSRCAVQLTGNVLLHRESQRVLEANLGSPMPLSRVLRSDFVLDHSKMT